MDFHSFENLKIYKKIIFIVYIYALYLKAIEIFNNEIKIFLKRKIGVSIVSWTS